MIYKLTAKSGVMNVSEVSRLKALENENNCLVRILTVAMLDSESCPRLVKGQWRAP